MSQLTLACASKMLNIDISGERYHLADTQSSHFRGVGPATKLGKELVVPRVPRPQRSDHERHHFRRLVTR